MKPCSVPTKRSALVRSAVKTFALTAIAASVAAFVPQAHAGVVTYSLSQYVGSGTAPSGPYGVVTLTSSGSSNVNVSVSLAGTEGFVDTGAGHSLVWEMGNSPLTITNLTSDFSVVGGSLTGSTWTVSSANNTLHTGGAGYWDYAVTCAGGACGSGGSSPYTGKLDFTVENVDLGDFMANADNFHFAADICTYVVDGKCGPGGLTGNIAGGPGTTVPEPGTLALFAAGLLGVGLFAARRRRMWQS